MVYHGPREDILPFFESQGMHCPPRKADSDFLHEVTSRKDQQVGAHTTSGPCSLLALFLALLHYLACCQYTMHTSVNHTACILPVVVAVVCLPASGLPSYLPDRREHHVFT